VSGFNFVRRLLKHLAGDAFNPWAIIGRRINPCRQAFTL
jgi:hypothetical protein